MAHAQTAAITFVLSRRLLPDASICLQYCLARGYAMVGVVRDDWAEALRLLRTGFASVIVVADERSLPRAGTPRIEVAAHETKKPTNAGPAADRPGSRQRTHLVSRQNEEA